MPYRRHEASYFGSVSPVGEIDRKDSDLRLQAMDTENQEFCILKNLLFPYLIDIDAEIPKLLNSCLTFNEDNIIESITLITNCAKSAVKLHEPRLLQENKYDDSVAAVITELVIKYLLSGIYNIEKVPEGLAKKIQNAILNPYKKPVEDLRAVFIEIDNKNDIVIHAVAELAINYIYTHQDRDIDTDKLIRSYFIKIDEQIISKVTNKI